MVIHNVRNTEPRRVEDLKTSELSISCLVLRPIVNKIQGYRLKNVLMFFLKLLQGLWYILLKFLSCDPVCFLPLLVGNATGYKNGQNVFFSETYI